VNPESWWRQLKGHDYGPAHNLFGAVQSAMLSAGVLVGGIWTYSVYHGTLQPKLAAAQLADLSRDIVNISLGASVYRIDTSQVRHLVITVKVEKNGACVATLTLHRHWQPMYVARVEYSGATTRLMAGEEKTPQAFAILFNTGNNIPIAQQAVPPKATRTLSYYVAVDKPGIYFLRFHTPVSLAAPCGLNRNGVTPPAATGPLVDMRPDSLAALFEKALMWVASSYVVVQ